MTSELLHENLITLSIEDLEKIILRDQELKKRREENDPVLQAPEEAGYNFKENCCEE